MAQTGLCPGCMRELGKDVIETSEQKTGGQKMSAPGRHSQQGQREDGARCPYCGFCPSEYQQNPRCLPSDTILAGKYLVGKVLGEGGFGITYMGYDLNMKTRVAIKEYFPVELKGYCETDGGWVRRSIRKLCARRIGFRRRERPGDLLER